MAWRLNSSKGVKHTKFLSYLGILVVYFMVSWQPSFGVPGSLCAADLANEGRPRAQYMYASWSFKGRSLPPDRLVSMETWRQWGAEDYLKYDGRLLGFEVPGVKSIGEWLVVEVLGFRHLSASERGAVISIYSELARRPVETEIGVLVINKKHGDPEVHIIESHSRAHIDGKKAIIPVSRANPEGGDIVSVQFFHNHPSRGPLSKGDIEVADSWSKFFAFDNPHRFPIHMYSIANFGGEMVLFHYGAR